MKTAIAKIVGASPYSQSRMFTPQEVPMLEKESAKDYNTRTWRNHQHWDRKTGEIYIPPTALKNALMEVAQYLGERIEGKGKSTWTKHFKAGVLCTEPVMLNVKWDQTDCETFNCHSNGIRGSGSRVQRTFPVIREWSGTAKFMVLDETITEDVFLRYLQEAGRFIGIGRFRPHNGGFYGRFNVADLKWR